MHKRKPTRKEKQLIRKRMKGDYNPWKDKWNWLYLIPLILSLAAFFR